MTTRLSVNINDKTAQALQELASRLDTTVTEIVRRAVSVYKVVDDETHKGKRLQIVSDDEVVTYRMVAPNRTRNDPDA